MKKILVFFVCLICAWAVHAQGCSEPTLSVAYAKLTFSVPGVTSQKAVFTKNAGGAQVYISCGNLRYQPGTGTWRFAAHQYEDLISNPSNNSGSTVWQGRFAWASSNYGSNYAWGSDDYSVAGNSGNDITGAYDWGYNQIWDGPDVIPGGTFYTLSDGEWRYILLDRANADDKRAQATINGVSGLVLLPDVWPDNVTVPFNPSITNVYSIPQWIELESLGAIFLPSADYWTGTHTGPQSAVYFTIPSVSTGQVVRRYNAKAVRLVRNL